MKKRFITGIAGLLAAVLLVAAAGGCRAKENNGPVSAEYFGLIGHGAGSLGHAVVILDRAGKIQDFQFDEYFLPSEWAPLRAETENDKAIVGYAIEDFVVAYTPKEGVKIRELTNEEADKSKLNDARNSPSARKEDGKPYKTEKGGVMTAEEAQLFFTKSQKEALDYVDAINDSKIFVLEFVEESHKDYTVNFGTVDEPDLKFYKKRQASPPSYGNYNKMDVNNNYWEEGGLGYKKNMHNFINFIKTNGFPVSNEESVMAERIVRGDDGVYRVADTVTHATMTRFTDYYTIGYEAYKRAMEKLR